MARTTPLVDHAHLRPAPDAAPIAVGSAAWYVWLDAATTFAFVDAQGRFTARKEHRGRDGGGYWKAYRRWGGTLHRAYLGTSATLTLERLTAASASLAPPVPDAPAAAAQRPRSPARGSRAAGPPAAPLLATKLFMPPVRPAVLPRPHLLARLQAGLAGPLTLLAAPAGFGKTTLLSAWRASVAGSAVPLAWVSLDAADRDPARFWSYVITALDQLQPGVAAALSALQSVQAPSIEAILTGVLNALSTLAADAVLVLDDYHVLQSPAIHAGMTFLLDHLPPQLHVVIATREDPALPLARLRGRGQLTELRAADLRFSTEEAAALLQTVMGLPLTTADVAALEAHTEGWIAGLHLAALAMRDRSDLTGFIGRFTGSNRFILDYLASEVLDRLPPHLRRFVVSSSILDRMCGSLCDAVVAGQGVTWERLSQDDEPATPHQQPAGEQVLADLERLNLFLVPLDHERSWYRYHHLFGEVLRDRLLRDMPHERVGAMHRRASAWFEAHGFGADALQHSLAASDWAHAVRLAEQILPMVAFQGQVHTALGWLEALPDALIRATPTLCVYHAGVLMYTNQINAAETRLDQAEQAVPPDWPPEQARVIQGQVAVIRAATRRNRGDVASCVALSLHALALLPDPETAPLKLRATALANAARAFLVRGDVTPTTERAVAAVIEPVRVAGNRHAFLSSITILARLHVLQGRLREAALTYQRALQIVPGTQELQALVGSPAYYAGLGDLHREWNDLDAAAELLTQGMHLFTGTLSVDADVVTLAYLAQARLQHARGNTMDALQTLQAFVDLGRRHAFFPILTARGIALHARLELAQGNLQAALQWADAQDPYTDTDTRFLREEELLTLARVRIAQARHAPAPQQGAETVRLLDSLREAAETGGRIGSVIELLILRALAADVQGDTLAAVTNLERALTLAAPEGYVRIFVDEGAAMEALLARIVDRGSSVAAYAATLLTAGSPATVSAGPPSSIVSEQYTATRPPQHNLVEPLSAREREVLELIAAGHSNQEIADRLVVAVSTVKKHINNVYGKLAVQSRTQALLRARELNLL